MTTANKITITRILLVPLFVVLLVLFLRGGEEKYRVAAIVCFALAAGSDGVDGYVARHFNQRTELGAILDPLADKLLLTSALVVLCFDSHQRLAHLPVWLLAMVLAREIILLMGMVAIRGTAGKFVARPRVTGKLATIVLMAAVLWAMLKWPPPVLPFLTVGGGILIAISGAYYLADFMRQFRGEGAMVGKEAPGG
jgi:cardiolipin synthase (CMP-forming)